MSYKILIGIAFGALSIGSAYALTAAHNLVQTQSDLALPAIAPALTQEEIDPILARPVQQETTVAPVVASLNPNLEQFAEPTKESFAAVGTSPRPLARILVPAHNTDADNDMNRSVQSSQRVTHINELWTIGVFR